MSQEEASASRVVVIVGQGGIQTDLDLDTLGEDEIAGVIPDLLADYVAECKDWTLVAGEHWRQGRWARAEEVLQKGLQFFAGAPGRPQDHTAMVNLHAMLAHLHLAQARPAPKTILPYTKYDKLPTDIKTKEYHYTEATANLNAADEMLRRSGMGVEDEPVSVSMGKIILYLARGQPQIAHPLVERLLQKQPNNLIALTALARLQFARRAHEAAFATYQKLLSLDPDMSPDPRIGLGLCAWVLGDRDRAKAAWQRALQRSEISPSTHSSWVPLLLLGLSSLNTAREPSLPPSERVAHEATGIAHVQKAFKLNNKSPAAALALSAVSGQGGQLPLASKLAERAVQYADNKRHSVLANAERGRLGFVGGDVGDAGRFIAAAKAEDPQGVNIIAELTLGQIAIKSGNLREALNFIETTAKRLNGKGPLEYTVLHACLLAYPHPGMKDDELERNRLTARNMLSEVHHLVANASTDADWARLRGVGEDADIFVDLARLWQEESLEKAIGAYQTAVTIKGDEADIKGTRMSANLGSLFQLQGNVETAERMYHEALERLTNQDGKEAETLRTLLAYNLGRAFEEEGEVVKAAQWYRDVLRQHPEHMESKVRLAMLAAAAGRNLDAHTLLKECLKSDETNITLRTVYSNFLISLGSYREALAFTSQTLKYDRSDPATYCALGWLHFALGREAKTAQELGERTKQYVRSAEAYERALVLDPTCAVAAQGLAIALAEDTLALRPSGPVGGAEEQKSRMRAAGHALAIFSRLNDSLADGSVGVNMGHCYFVRGEDEKAIQSYEAASNWFKGRNVPVLLYLARAWYAYANRESNFTAMSKALFYCQSAMHLQPSDRAILYNIAMIQQKSAEMLFGLEPARRTLEELNQGLKQAQQAASMFRALADDKAGPHPYDVDLADQRARYGDGLLRKAPEQIAKQEAYEGEAAARVEEARKARAAEQERIAAAEAARKAEIEQRALALAEQRQKAQAEAMAWQEELNRREAEEETRRAQAVEKRKKRKEKGEIESADEGEGQDGGEGKKRKRTKPSASKGGKKGRKVRSKSEVSSEDDGGAVVKDEETDEEEEEARMSDGVEGEGGEVEGEGGEDKRQRTIQMLKAKKKKAKRPVVDPDEEEATPKKGGKQFKSKAFIEDSDEDAEMGEDDDEPDTKAESSNGMELDEQENGKVASDDDDDDE